MLKLYIEGFRGPWGWVSEFESKNFEDVQIVKCQEDCDVLFQCDPSNWKINSKFLGSKFVIANVLDYAEWNGGNPDIEEYSKEFVSLSNVTCGISGKVRKQMIERGISDPIMFHYPSQISIDIMRNCLTIPKKNMITSFCRINDPGKRISEAIDCFTNSLLPSYGWKYNLIGPEIPNFKYDKDCVRYLGFLDVKSLYGLVAASRYTLMPSIGEGLGLPAIESILVGTTPIVRNIEPMKSVLGSSSIYFEDMDDLRRIFHENPIAFLDSNKFLSYERNEAFRLFVKLIKESYDNRPKK